jgi:hypothetical protein
MLCHGWSGASLSASFPNLRAASLMIRERVQDGVKCLLVLGKTICIKPCRKPLYSGDILKVVGKSLICFSEGKRRISLDDAPQPLLVNWLRDNIDRAAEYLLKALSERIQPPEIGKAALRLFRAQPDDNIHIRTIGRIAASDGSEDRQSRYPRSL